MEKYINTALLGVAVFLLGLIAYGTVIENLIPKPKPPTYLSCNSLLSQQLFYSELIGKDDSNDENLKSTARNVMTTTSTQLIAQLVTDNTNIDGTRTVFFSSLSNPDDCQAHLSLKHAKEDGTNAMYVPYSISGYLPTDVTKRSDGDVLEEMHINFLGIDNEKE